MRVIVCAGICLRIVGTHEVVARVRMQVAYATAARKSASDQFFFFYINREGPTLCILVSARRTVCVSVRSGGEMEWERIPNGQRRAKGVRRRGCVHQMSLARTRWGVYASDDVDNKFK